MNRLRSQLKPFLRWAILGATLFFLIKTLKDNAASVAQLQITGSSWIALAIALGVTFLAHLWSGWVWLWILREFDRPVPLGWGLSIYLTTNIAKYLPGNVWHFYGRISAIAKRDVPLAVAVLSVLLEPLLMAASALIIAGLGSSTLWGTAPGGVPPILLGLGLGAVLGGIHPRILNPIIQVLSKLKLKKAPPKTEGLLEVSPESPPPTAAKLTRYPLLPLLGELGFLLLRGAGFILTVQAMTLVQPGQIPPLMGAFSFAWLLGLVVPGAPGGIGIFEATAIALLDQQFSPAAILGAVAFYRLISVVAEASAAAIAALIGKGNPA
ncbi:lysylphosphatidylglycerol synthase domain-containing protein [Laspinema olomoucense]|uniref:lysylphosphatidylglycerol synthase domain-containing protein n=1 Tax=Laspinema olomoucense TaxID=3231600 RepID=UPI0021BAB3F0|nr:lysylphosphatidylglycerol synthase domain-containing protein [Laspinema sp. D3c]MCT7994879.1 lysylphosphatidylglycerol synthase domain-containing protein [Laspinema sp. D3c]